MENKKLRVVIIGTGNVSSIAARCIQGREDMELVGVWAHRETASEKIGMDAGLLDGNEPCGVIVTDDLDEIMALQADCALIGINIIDVNKQEQVLAPWYLRFLEAGTNIVSTSMLSLIYPPAYENQEFVYQLEAACKKGNASFYMSGEEPGFAEQLAAVLSTGSNTIKTITISEIFRYDCNIDGNWMATTFGFGCPADYKSLAEAPEFLKNQWLGPVLYLSDKLGYKLEEVRTSYEKRLADENMKTNFGIIKKGTVGAIRFKTIGVVEGRDAIVVEHVNRMGPDIAPDWPTAYRDGTIQIRIEGDPNLTLDFVMGDPKHPAEQGYEGYVLTCMRILNAIPYVCAAEPGVLNSQKLPLTTPVNAFRSDVTSINHRVFRA